MANYIPSSRLTHDQILELQVHTTVEVAGRVYRFWRHDHRGQAWLVEVTPENTPVEPVFSGYLVGVADDYPLPQKGINKCNF